MKRVASVAFALALLLASVAVPVRRASASDAWCSDDPIVLVNGTIYDITVQAPVADRATVGVVTVSIPTPIGAHAKVLYSDSRSFQETVVFVANGGSPTQTTAISSNPSVPTRVIVRRFN